MPVEKTTPLFVLFSLLGSINISSLLVMISTYALSSSMLELSHLFLSKLRWFSTERIRRSQSVCHRMQNNMLCLAMTLDGGTLAVGTRSGEVHLWSTLACSCPSLKSCCRATINSQRAPQRRQIRRISLSSDLINYLMYKDDTIK